MIPPPPISTLFPYTTLFRSGDRQRVPARARAREGGVCVLDEDVDLAAAKAHVVVAEQRAREEPGLRSEEHTSEVQSRQYLVCRLLFDKNTLITRMPSSACKK